MKCFEEIRANKRFQGKEKTIDGGSGWVTIRGKMFSVVYSNGGGWDHVFVSLPNRCPTWDEMCDIKDIFFNENECCIEYHPKKQDYVNIHRYCLHIWKPQDVELPTPPKIFV